MIYFVTILFFLSSFSLLTELFSTEEASSSVEFSLSESCLSEAPEQPLPEQLPVETIPNFLIDSGVTTPDEHVFGQRVPPLLLMKNPEELEPLPLIIPYQPDPDFFEEQEIFPLLPSVKRIKRKILEKSKLNQKIQTIEKKIAQKVLKNWVIPTKELQGRTELSIAASVSKTGENHIMGSHCFEGLMLFINNKNKEKNSTAPMMRVFSENDNSDLLKAKKNIQLLKFQSPLFVSLSGDDIVRECSTIIDEQGLLSLFSYAGLKSLRENPSRNKIYLRPPYRRELHLLCKYAICALKKESFALFYEDSSWGRALREELTEELAQHGKKADVEASYPEGSVNILQAVKTIAQKGPAVIFCLAHPRAAAVFMRRALNEGLYKSVFLGLSELIAIQSALKKLRGIEMVTTSAVPDPQKSTIPLAQEFREAMKKELPNRIISPFFFEGYITGALLSYLFSKISAPYTTMKLIKAAEAAGAFELGGLPLSFDPDSRSFSSQVWINEGGDKPFLSEEAIDKL